MADEKASMKPNDDSLQGLEITEDDLETSAGFLEAYTSVCATFRDAVIQFKETDIDRLYTRPIGSITVNFTESENVRPIAAMAAEIEEAKKKRAK